MKLKKLASLVLALAVSIGMGTASAFAADSSGSLEGTKVTTATTGTIKINAQNQGDTFDAYRIVDITYNADNTLTYAFDSTVAAFFTGKNVTAEGYCNLTNYPDNSDQLKTLLGELAAWIKTSNITTANHLTADSTKSATLGSLALGQYLVLGAGNQTSGAYVYQIMTANLEPKIEQDASGNSVYTLKTAEATNKSTVPTIAKAVVDDNDTDVSFYDKINYTITVTVPTYPAAASNTMFKVNDVQPAGVAFVPDTLVVKGFTSDADTAGTVIAGANNFDADGNYTFVYSAIKAYTKITLTYTGILAAEAAMNTNLTNTATLTYSVEPYGAKTSTVSASAAVKTYGLSFVKVDHDDKTKALANAEFDVYAKLSAAQAANLNSTAYAAEAGTNLVSMLRTAASAAAADTDGYYKIGHVATDANGNAALSRLEPGSYYLVETKAPTGYQIATNAIAVTVNSSMDSNTIENTKNGLILPGTGSTGTQLFTVGGLLILACAGAFLFFNRKRVFSK